MPVFIGWFYLHIFYVFSIDENNSIPFSKNNISFSIEASKKEVLKDPTNSVQHYFLGIAYFIEKNYQEAEKSFRNALSLDPKDDDIYYALALSEHRMKHYPKALSWYLKAIEIDPNSFIYYFDTGLAYMALEEYKKAFACFKKSTLIKPSFTSGYYNMAFSLEKQKKYDEALDMYQKTLLIDPSHTSSMVNIGKIYTDKGFYEKALAFFEKAISLNPNDASFYYNAAIVFQKKGSLEKALNYNEKALSINPLYAEALNNTGTLYEILGNRTAAIDFFKKSYDVNSNFSDAAYNIGLFYVSSESYENALIYLEKAFALDPNNTDILLELAQVLNYLGKRTQAITLYQNLMSRSLYKEKASFYLSETYFKNGDMQKSEEEIFNYIEKNPKDLQAYILLTQITMKQARWKEAEASAKAGLNIDAKNIVLQILLAEILSTQGFLEKSIDCYKKAFSLSPMDIKIAYSWSLEEFKRGNIFKVKEIMDPFFKNFSESYEVLHIQAKMARKNKDFKKEKEIYENMIKKYPQKNIFYTELCRIYTQEGLLEQAEASCKNALKLQAHAEAWYYLGYIYIEKNDLKQSEIFFKKSVEINPYDTNAYYALAQLEEKQKNLEKSLFYYQKIISFNPTHTSSVLASERIQKILTATKPNKQEQGR
jgi:tetratricopeptide (TPR) repeat protein